MLVKNGSGQTLVGLLWFSVKYTRVAVPCLTTGRAQQASGWRHQAIHLSFHPSIHPSITTGFATLAVFWQPRKAGVTCDSLAAVARLAHITPPHLRLVSESTKDAMNSLKPGLVGLCPLSPWKPLIFNLSPPGTSSFGSHSCAGSDSLPVTF